MSPVEEGMKIVFFIFSESIVSQFQFEFHRENRGRRKVRLVEVVLLIGRGSGMTKEDFGWKSVIEKTFDSCL